MSASVSPIVLNHLDVVRRSIDRLKKYGETKEDNSVVDMADHLKTEFNYLKQVIEIYSKRRDD